MTNILKTEIYPAKGNRMRVGMLGIGFEEACVVLPIFKNLN